MKESLIGRIYRLKVFCLGNSVGTLGYVFNQYPDFDYPDLWGVQIIFPNGEYDGFSYDEQEQLLEYEGYDWRYVGYNFTNVMKVSKDFDSGYWEWE